MMKLKANPKDTASSKQKQRPGSATPSASGGPKLMATSPLPQHEIYPSKSIDMSMADGIDSTAPGLNESIISAGSETIDSMEEKKMDNPSSPMQHAHYSPNKLAAMRTAQFSIDADNYRASPPHYDVSQPHPQSLPQQPHEKPPQHPQSQSPQLFNDAWSSDPWNDTFWSTSSSKPNGSGSRDGQSPTHPQQQNNPDVSFDTLQFQPRIPPSPDTNNENNNDNAVAAAMDPSGIRLAETFDTTWAASTDIGTHAFSDAAVNTTINTVQSATVRQRNFVKVHVAVQERLSILFDEAAKGPICRVVGSIFVKPPELSPPSPEHGKKYCFCLTIRDKKGSIEQWDEASKNICENITASVPHNAVDPGDQVFMVSLREGREESLGAPLVRYTCIPRLRPMPMLLKTKVHRKGSVCRVGIRLRSNPQNNYLLTDIAVLMIVPLDMDGSSLSMSRQDGVWDKLKRTLTWTIQELPPGELIDIQAQFKVIEGVSSTETSSKFPVLARCNGRTSFSRIDINSDYTEEGAIPVELEVSRSTNVLYRKV